MSTIFLILSLFLPRITLLIYYFGFSIPPNSVPFWGDAILAVFLPRVLVLIYIYENMGTQNPWFWIHLVVALMVYLFSGKKASRKRKW